MVDASGQSMAVWAEVLGDRTIGGNEPLGLAGRLKPLPAPLALTCWMVRVLRSIIEIPVLAMFDSWKTFSLGSSVALEFIGDDDPRHVC